MEYKFNIGDIVLDHDNSTVLICDRYVLDNKKDIIYNVIRKNIRKEYIYLTVGNCSENCLTNKKPSFEQLNEFFNFDDTIVSTSFIKNKELFYKKRKVFNRKNNLKKIEKYNG